MSLLMGNIPVVAVYSNGLPSMSILCFVSIGAASVSSGYTSGFFSSAGAGFSFSGMTVSSLARSWGF